MVFKAEGRAQCLSVLARARTNLNAKRVFYNRPLTIRAYSGIANSIIGGGGGVIEDTKVTTTDCERDLGVWVSSNLTWKKQVCNQTSKANKSLGYIKRNTRFVKSTEARRMFYLALVRSHFGYATQIWAPQSIELINHLERTQRRATKYILNLPFSSDIDYKSRLQSLHLRPICYWHEYLDLILFFKITHGLLKTSASPVIQSSRRTTRSNSSNPVKYVNHPQM